MLMPRNSQRGEQKSKLGVLLMMDILKTEAEQRYSLRRSEEPRPSSKEPHKHNMYE